MVGVELISTDFLSIALALLVAGGVTGVLAGMFGVGVGALIVPVLYGVFGALGIPDDVRMRLAVGTSLAIIIPTSIRSCVGHRARVAAQSATSGWMGSNRPAAGRNRVRFADGTIAVRADHDRDR